MSGVSFRLNGRNVVSASPAVTRLSNVLRDEFRATGTKSGCDAGDCGACTVQIDGELACACLVPVAEAEGRSVVTVEGLAANTSTGQALQDSFLAQGAAPASERGAKGFKDHGFGHGWLLIEEYLQ